MNEFSKDKPTSQQLVDLIDEELDITISRDVVYGLDFEYKQLQQENQQLKSMICPIYEKCQKGECDCTHEEYRSMCETNMKIIDELNEYKSVIDEARKFIKEKYEEDYSKNDNYNPIERLNLKNCSYERSLQVLEILNKVGDVK